MAKETKRISAYALILNEDNILLSKLNRGPNIGSWNLIGGGIKHGEAPLETLVREIKEESGIILDVSPELLTVLSERFLYTTPEGIEDDLHLLGIIYLIKLSEKIECKLDGDGDSSDGCKWFPIKELQNESVVSFVFASLNLIDKH